MEVELSFGYSFEFSLFGLESFVDKYKTMEISAEEEELDLNKADVEVVVDERWARRPPEPPPWSASKSRVWKKMDEFIFNFVLFSLCFSVELLVVWFSFVFLFLLYSCL
ncbi:unnamed protein product [Cuscuta epithymum]|uniref:Transmembrane protein n=1 Tax=Cuscuta epithymum TaxID=186058 RepID=A0AAV0F125_9ASTE|nr:unnamed protein product [Cuscuta epithymum]